MIQGLPAGHSVDLSELVLAGGLDDGPALVIDECSGAILLDGLQVQGSVIVSGSKSVLFQSCELDSLSLEHGSSASILSGSVGEIRLSGRSRLETWGLHGKPTVGPGSRWIPHEESPPWLEVIELAPTRVEVRLQAQAGSLWWLSSSDVLTDLIDGIGQGGSLLSTPRLFLDKGSTDRVLAIPHGLMGSTLYLRATVIDTNRRSVELSNVQRHPVHENKLR